MPQPASRKRSLGTTSRRGPQRAHVPFRGDDLEHGKKTGKPVNQVVRDADDFEPFQDVLDQAYAAGGSAAPRAPNNTSTVAQSTISHGDISFTELAQSDGGGADILDDDRYLFLPPRTDKGKGREVVRGDSDVSAGAVLEDAVIEDDIAAGLQEIEDERFSEGDGEEEEPGPSNKRSRRDQNDVTSKSEPKKPIKKPKPKRTNEQHRHSLQDTTNQGGVRRSQRRHYPPLEYWRQEKVVWGRREKGPDKGSCYVPVIKEIITIPKPPPQALGAKKRKRAGTHAPKSKTDSLPPESDAKEVVRVVEVDNPELGWDDETPSHGIIVDFDENQEVQRRVTFTAKMVKPVRAGNNNYLFQKIFGDGDFIAGGQLVIPPGQEKPAKPTKDNTYIFYLIQGAVQFRVHRSTFVLATGGMFLVPRGNQYYIENICERDAKLFFAQARKIVRGDNRVPSVESRMSTAPGARAHTAPRASSHAAPSPKQYRDTAVV